MSRHVEYYAGRRPVSLEVVGAFLVAAAPAARHGTRPNPLGKAMTQAEVEICNELGLHLRAAGTFVRLASRFKAQIRVATEGIGAVDGKSILGLVTLGTAKGALLEIRAEGPDEVEAVRALSELVASGFGE